MTETELKPLTPIPFRLSRNFQPSAWTLLDPLFIYAGEDAQIVGYWLADATNPLYQVRNQSGVELPIYRRELIKHGADFYP